MKKWEITHKSENQDIIGVLLENRGLKSKKEIDQFLQPPDPNNFGAVDVGIDPKELKKAITRITEAIKNKESIVVYADYDADGITAGTIMWETLFRLGAKVMPYIPHRVDEGYGLSVKGIDSVKKQYNPTLIITVDHGITAYEKVVYAKDLGIEVIVTDHHTKPKKLPDCTIVHTTNLCGAGVSWFVAKSLLTNSRLPILHSQELLALAAIGTIADLVPLVGVNRSIVSFGLKAIRTTKRVGLDALIQEAGVSKSALTTFDISHVLAPRLNAMGRLVHAIDALRLLCTSQGDKAVALARKLGLTNKERQQLTIDSSRHAILTLQGVPLQKLIFVSHESYNQGIIGLVAGKLVEEYYRPSVVLFKGETISKGSARSIAGFNIVEAIKLCSDLLIDVGGHPMAAGFTVETKNLDALKGRLEEFAEKELNEDSLKRVLRIDTEIPLQLANEELWNAMQGFQPFGFGNLEPVFATSNVHIADMRMIGKDNKHLKLQVSSLDSPISINAVAFNMGNLYPELRPDKPIDIAYSIDMNEWNGSRKLQLKIKDIRL